MVQCAKIHDCLADHEILYTCMWMHLERNATDGIHFIELRVIHAQMTSFGLWPAIPAGRVGRKRSRACWGMNKLIQVAPEWIVSEDDGK